MAKLSQSQRIVEFLKLHPDEKFNARQLEESIVALFPSDYIEKRQNPRFSDENDFLAQIVAEIGSQKDQIVKTDSRVCWQDKPRPRVYWFDSNSSVNPIAATVSENDDDEEIITVTSSQTTQFTEHDLYPILIEYLKSELKLLCLRIDEKRSKNSYGKGGNQWLHPDIVAMQPVDKEWNDLVRNCAKLGSGQTVRLWSFEVKKELNSSNVRKSFFQAVSNSSWANEGYLVATSISDAVVEQELRMLSQLHGIGVILLNPQNPTESEMMLPATARAEVDWQSVNRILTENEDFKDYIDLVSTYFQTGRVRVKDWNK